MGKQHCQRRIVGQSQDIARAWAVSSLFVAFFNWRSARGLFDTIRYMFGFLWPVFAPNFSPLYSRMHASGAPYRRTGVAALDGSLPVVARVSIRGSLWEGGCQWEAVGRESVVCDVTETRGTFCSVRPPDGGRLLCGQHLGGAAALRRCPRPR